MAVIVHHGRILGVLILMFLEDTEKYREAKPNAKFAWDHEGVLRQIKHVSGQGKTPIQSFELYGHGGSGSEVFTSTKFENKVKKAFPEAPVMVGFNLYKDLTSVGTRISIDPNSPKPTYERAKQKQGPKRTRISRNARVIGLGCKGDDFAKSMAENWLRVGATARGSTKLLYDFGTSEPITEKDLEEFNSLDELLYQSVYWAKFGGAL